MMTDIGKMDNSAREYYDTLPPLIQEQILRNSAGMLSKSELQAFYTNILRSGPNTVKPDSYI